MKTQNLKIFEIKDVPKYSVQGQVENGTHNHHGLNLTQPNQIDCFQINDDRHVTEDQVTKKKACP